MTLLISDLDNTLYDWVTYFGRAFREMVTELPPLLGVDEEQILGEFKVVHEKYRNTEQPFAVLELPSVTSRFPGKSRRELALTLAGPLEAFNRAREQHLTLYDSVKDTLIGLRGGGVRIVGHTEAILVNSYQRLERLGILGCFDRLYTIEGQWAPHPIRPEETLGHDPDFVQEVPFSERKPNPGLLIHICGREGVPVDSAWYVGDSLLRDVAMAKAAGLRAVWARYGTKHDPEAWKTVVQVSHWTQEDIEREERLRQDFAGVEPDHTIDRFEELSTLLPVEN